MDLPFLRNQIELKLSELDSLLSNYNSRLKREFKFFSDVIDDDQRKELKGLLLEIESCKEAAKEIEEEFQITVAQLSLIHTEILKKAKSIAVEYGKNMISTFEDVTITRQPLKYSQFVDSIGYDKVSKSLDVCYNSGSIYRYYNVPEEYFDDLTNRNNFKGFKTEIAKFDSKKIEDPT
jgi:hypothetical protein